MMVSINPTNQHQDNTEDPFVDWSAMLALYQSEDFQRDTAAWIEEGRAKRRPVQRKANRRYRERHPEFEKMRREAEVYKPMLYERQQGLCKWCGLTLNTDYQVDHIVPLIRNGTSDLSNLCVCCPTCNHRKGTKIIEQAI